MFWGLLIKSNKRYSQTVLKSFHLSQAALDTTTANDDDVQVFLTTEEHTHLLCTLKKNVINQAPLNFDFATGDKLSFTIKGSGVVHLTGFLIPDDIMDLGEEDSDEGDLNMDELEDESDDDEVAAAALLASQKSKKSDKKKPAAAAVPEEAADSDDDDDDEDDDDDDVEEDEDDSDASEEEEEDDEVEVPSKKQKIDNKSKATGVENGKVSPKEQKKDKNQQKQKEDNKQQPKQGKRTLQGGVTVEDLKVGAGNEAKNGKKVMVYYEGKLQQNNKVFDSTKTGPGFKFVLGRGEVISGWDVGVAGMKVGGKRRVTCPPKMAYGAKGHPPVIPGNSTLVFDVELRNVL